MYPFIYPVYSPALKSVYVRVSMCMHAYNIFHVFTSILHNVRPAQAECSLPSDNDSHWTASTMANCSDRINKL